MPTRKMWDHIIDVKEGFVLRNGRYTHCQEKREKRCTSL